MQRSSKRETATTARDDRLIHTLQEENFPWENPIDNIQRKPDVWLKDWEEAQHEAADFSSQWADLKKNVDASEIHARRLNAKGSSDAERGWTSRFPIADGTAKVSGRDHGVRESTPRDQLVSSEDLREDRSGKLGEDSSDRRNKRRRRSPQWFLVSWRRFRSSSSRRTLSSTPRAEGRKYSQSHWKMLTWPGLRRQIWTWFQESRMEDNLKCRFGSKFVRLMDRIHEVHSAEWETSMRIYVVQGAAYKNSSNYHTWLFVAWTMVPHVKGSSQKKKKHRWAIGKPKLDIPWKLRGIYFIDPEDGEFKVTIKNTQGRSWRYQWRRLCLVSWGHRNVRTCPRGNRRRNQTVPTKSKKTKHACIVEADEFKGKRLGSILPEDHENHIAEKGFNSMSHWTLVHKFVPMPQAMKVPDAKAAVDEA